MKTNVSIIGKKMDVGDALRDSIIRVYEGFEKYNMNIISRKAVLRKNKKKEMSVELVLELKGKHTIVIDSTDKDVYEALATSASRVEKALRRLSDKVKNHRKNISLKDMKPESAILHYDEEKTMDEEIDGIIKVEMKLQKPLDLEDAILRLRDNKDVQFFVFNDRQGQVRTIFKRADGQIGIY